MSEEEVNIFAHLDLLLLITYLTVKCFVLIVKFTVKSAVTVKGAVISQLNLPPTRGHSIELLTYRYLAGKCIVFIVRCAVFPVNAFYFIVKFMGTLVASKLTCNYTSCLQQCIGNP